MKKIGKKEAIILIPLFSFSVLILISVLINNDEQSIITSSECQEGWFKYETDNGILCSKTELTETEISEIGK